MPLRPTLAAVIKEVKLVLKGNVNEVIGEGEENKQMFLDACTLKLSKNNTRDVRCVGVRPGSKGSFVVDIEGAPKKLKELAKELKTEESFVLQGYAELTIDKVETTTKSPLEEIEEIGAQIIKYLTENGSNSLFNHQHTSE